MLLAGLLKPQGPWTLRIDAVKPLGFRAALRNVSTGEQLCLIDSRQPMTVELRGPSGKTVELFDERSRAKYDSTVYRDSYTAIKPGADSRWRDGVFAAEHGAYTMRFGHFSATGLAAGLYKIRALWVSAEDRYFDPDTKRAGVMPAIWKGRVESAPIEIRLP